MSNYNDLCLRYFGKSLYGGFKSTVDDVVWNTTNTYTKRVIYVPNYNSNSSTFLANYDTMAQLVMMEKKKKYLITSDYFDLFKENIDQFINPTIDDDSLYKKYFGCYLTKWEKNIVELLDRPYTNTIKDFTKNENAIYNYTILLSYISKTIHFSPTVYLATKYFRENEKNFKELSTTANSTTTIDILINPEENSTGITNNGSSSSASTAPPPITDDSNTELNSKTTNNNELTEKKLMERNEELINSNNQQQQTIKTQQEKISNLELQVKDLQKHADDNNLLKKENNLLKEKISKLELHLSHKNTQQYLELARNVLLKYFTKLNKNSKIMIRSQDKIASLESICNELVTLREKSRTQQEELTKLSEINNTLSEQLQGLLKTKEQIDEVLLNCHVSNTSTEQIVDRVVKEAGTIQNDILDLLISIENLDDDQAKTLDKCLGMSLCHAFTKTSNLSTAIELAGKKFDELIIANSMNVIISEQLYQQLVSFLKTMVERMHRISNLGSNIKFHWFEMTNELKDMKIEYSTTIGQGTELERVEYYCLFPPLYVGETLQLDGRTFEIKYFK